jgi:hypothetical protein
MTNSTPDYTVSELRQVLNNSFDDEQRDGFCLDHYPDVFDQFGQGMRRDKKITLLLNHCRKHDGGLTRLGKLLHRKDASGVNSESKPISPPGPPDHGPNIHSPPTDDHSTIPSPPAVSAKITISDPLTNDIIQQIHDPVIKMIEEALRVDEHNQYWPPPAGRPARDETYTIVFFTRQVREVTALHSKADELYSKLTRGEAAAYVAEVETFFEEINNQMKPVSDLMDQVNALLTLRTPSEPRGMPVAFGPRHQLSMTVNAAVSAVSRHIIKACDTLQEIELVTAGASLNGDPDKRLAQQVYQLTLALLHLATQLENVCSTARAAAPSPN